MTGRDADNLVAALEAGQRRYGGELRTVMAEMELMVCGREPGDLAGADAVHFMLLQAQFESLAIKQRRYIEAEFQRLDADSA